jgi:hypothetical protein
MTFAACDLSLLALASLPRSAHTNKGVHMKPELKTNWLTALRDGSRKQGTGRLRSAADEFCCLGVLLDVAGCEWHLPKNRNRYETMSFGATGEACSLTDEMQTTFALSREAEAHLIDMNDGGHSFGEIADWIETHVPVDA